MAYLDVAGFRSRSLMAAGEIDYVENDSPGYIASRIAVRTSWIHARLRKRYGASLPFEVPYPEAILGWLTAMVTYDTMRKRGMNPSDPNAILYKEDAEKAEAEVKEAADSKEGLYDLPSFEDGDSNVSTGGPQGYSETSPYVAFDIERAIGRSEDNAVKSVTGNSDE